MDTLERLTSLFERFPGIGPRQAQRFVQFLLRSSPSMRRDLADAIAQLGGSVHQCTECLRFHAGEKKLCSICADPQRDHEFLAIVATDADFAALEKSGTYRGYYFVLGGTVSLSMEKNDGLRTKQLLSSIAERAKKGLKEIILAFPANPEGDATAERMREELSKKIIGDSITITSLGRGLSTGSELEYADTETIKNAFESRR